MNEIQIFNNAEFGEVRTVMIDNEPWFVGRDVAMALGYKKVTEAIQTNVEDEDSTLVGVSDANNHMQQTKVINESGLYSLIFGSKLESAKKFKKWVTSEVLPELRKTGGYGLPTTTDGKIQLLAQGHTELSNRMDGIEQRLEDFENNMPLLPVDAKVISGHVKSRAYNILGGRQSKAYQNPSIRRSLFRRLYISLNDNFGTTRYEEIKRRHKEKAIEFVREWKPPFVLQEKIDEENR